MKNGLLWFDGSKQSITIKILDAMRRYYQKHGVDADTVFVNPRDLRGALEVNGVQVQSKPTIMKNHIWLGVARKEGTPKPILDENTYVEALTGGAGAVR